MRTRSIAVIVASSVLGLLAPAAANAGVITAHPASSTQQTDATFVFSGSYYCALDGVRYRNADGAIATCPTTYYLPGPLSEGPHTFELESSPTGSAVESYGWTVDLTPPDTIVDQQPPALTNATAATFAFHSSDASATFQCALNGGAFAACSSPRSYAGLGDGTRTFSVRAIDAAGNVDLVSHTVTWKVDTQPPATTISGGPSGATNATGASFTLTSSEPGSTFECSLDGAAFAPCGTSPAFSSLGDGQHTFAARAIDPAGNVDPHPPAASWTIDTTPPAVPSAQLSQFVKSVSIHRPGRHGRRPRAVAPGPHITIGTVQPSIALFPGAHVAMRWSTAGVVKLTWGSTDPSTDHFVVRQVQRDINVGGGAEQVLANAAPMGSMLVKLAHGTNCLDVSAVDAAGNQSAPARRCVTVPWSWQDIQNGLDAAFQFDASNTYGLVDHPDLNLVSGSSYWSGTAKQVSSLPVLVWLGDGFVCGWGGCSGDGRPDMQLGAVALLATTCPTCGSVKVELSSPWSLGADGANFKPTPGTISYSHTISLTSSQTVHRKLIELPGAAGMSNDTTLVLERVSGAPIIEGIARIQSADLT